MAVVENVAADSTNRSDSAIQDSAMDHSKSNNFKSTNGNVDHTDFKQFDKVAYQTNGNGGAHQANVKVKKEGDYKDDEMRDLEEMLSKLNPMAKEFVPPSITGFGPVLQAPQFGYIADGSFVVHTSSPVAAGGNSVRRVILKF